jgi:putative DNA primase/helicase
MVAKGGAVMNTFSERELHRQQTNGDADHTSSDELDSHNFNVSFLANKSGTKLKSSVWTLPKLRDHILKTSGPTKLQLPWLKLATFGDVRSNKGSLRTDANVLSIEGIELDYDGLKVSFEEAVEAVRQMNVRALIYTSPSYNAATLKWRILLPLSNSETRAKERRVKYVARVNGYFKSAFKCEENFFSGETFTLSQGYFYGRAEDNPNANHQAEIIDGEFIDLRDDLQQYEADGAKAKARKAAGAPSGFESYLAVIGDGEGLAGFHDPIRSATAAYAGTHGAGWDREALKARLRDAINKAPKGPKRDPADIDRYLSDEYLDDLIESAIEKFALTDELAPAFSEEDLALRFSRRHRDELRFVAKWGQWYRYDGQRWKPDDTRKTFSLARDLCRDVASKVNKPREAKTIANAKTRMAVVSLASDDRRHAGTVDQWDSDPWLLNTLDGVIDLRSGKLMDARPDDYLTKLTSVAPDADCPTPLWSAFLDKVTNGDKDLQAFLARISGYSLTGSTREHALFFLYGTGGNGKGVFMNTLIGILGDYHRAAPIETFTETHADKHPTELAMLRGARMVTSTETEEGRRWAESRVKALTGGDPIAARFMRQDFFEYRPQFKLIISGNHKPGLRSVDEAIRRRFHLIPFVVTITPEERNPELSNDLVAEYPGILAWMIKGCLDWQNAGLAPPTAVTDATEHYLETEDAMKLWLEECCAKDPNFVTPVSVLFERWKAWAEDSGEFVGSARRFSQRLEANGFEPCRPHAGRSFRGLTVYRDPNAHQMDLKYIWSGM